MKPASNLREIGNGLWAWSSLHEEWQVDFNSCAWQGKDGLVLVDPIKLDDNNLLRLEKAGKPIAILLTNQNHERDADWFRTRYRIKIHVHRDAVPGIEITLDVFFCDGASVPGGLKAIHLPGASPSESAFYTERNGGIIFLGDIAVNLDAGLKFLSDEHCQNAKQNRESAKKLLALTFETMAFAHGDPIHPKAKQQFAKLFQA